MPKKKSPKVTLIVGLPGSGKTFLAHDLARSEDARVFDDMKMSDLKDIRKDILRHKKNMILVSPQLCFEATRKLVEATVKEWGATVQVIYFENDPEQCLKNVESRDDGRKVYFFIRDVSKEYKIPEDVNVICRVWRPEDESVDAPSRWIDNA